jgi:Ohr subfamily peroxiredoxin
MDRELDILYTAEATAVGGREGHARTNDGRLDVDLDVPGEMGGTSGLGTNPEQLLAAGWAACFQSSMQRFAFTRKVDLSGTRVTARISIGRLKSGGLGLAAAIDLDAPGIRRDRRCRADDAGARDLPLLAGHPRQYRGHADRRRRWPRPGRLTHPSLDTAVAAQLRRPSFIRRACGSRDSRANACPGFSPRRTGIRIARPYRSG